MDYEKRCNELVEAIKQLQETNPSDEGIQNWANDVLYGTKEVNDERIRKSQLDYWRSVGGKEWHGVPVQEAIAWLEKQGEKSAEWHREDEQNLNACLGYIPDEFLRRWLKDAIYVKYDKPADKILPKFKVGDWIITTDDEGDITIEKIIEFWGDKVRLVDTDGYYTLCPQHKLNYYHPWTIADAKDGDVLYSLDSNQPFIYKCRNDGEQATCYCGINKFGKFFIWNTEDCIITLDKYVPATQKQRSLLFEKMHEAGYEWDDEKKELKRIEEEYDGEDYGIDSLFHAQRILEKTPGKVDGYQSDDGILSHKCAISAVKKLYEKKSAKWTEEDDYNIQCCIAKVERDIANGYQGRNKELIEWLQSIKQRLEAQQ